MAEEMELFFFSKMEIFICFLILFEFARVDSESNGRKIDISSIESSKKLKFNDEGGKFASLISGFRGKEPHRFHDEDEDFHIGLNVNGSCGCWNATADGITREVECKCTGKTSRVPGHLAPDVHRITIQSAENFTSLGNEELKVYKESLREIVLTELPQFREIKDGTFYSMRNLDTIYIQGAPSLTHISLGAFKAFIPRLKTIRIVHSSLRSVPNLSQLSTMDPLHMVDLENNLIEFIEPGFFKNLKVEHLALSYNRLETIGPSAFEGSTIARLAIKGNRGLRELDPDAFEGIESLRELDLSETSIDSLPTKGLKHLEILRLEKVERLHVVPSIYNFEMIKEAWMTFPYHCCAFEFPQAHNPEDYKKFKDFLIRQEDMCRKNKEAIETKKRRRRLSLEDKGSNGTRTNNSFVFDPGSYFKGDEFDADSDEGSLSWEGDLKEDSDFAWHQGQVNPTSTIQHCGNLTQKKIPKVNCHPSPDAFSPCEDIMGNFWLRGAVWVVVALALIGNAAVLIVLLLAPGKLSVQRILMANLSVADLCMGIYLLIIATEDLISLGVYFNHAIDWQLGWGCQAAGFLTVLASELSVFTLAVITGERWYALTRAIDLTKRLTRSGAYKLMAFGWLLSLALAGLPLFGVSSYSKTSICLPMEANSLEAQAYLAFLLLFNGLAFTLVAIAYYQMYRTVAGHSHGDVAPADAADLAIAKKMALLVFTDFACWAPVAFFGLTAIAGSPLIGVTDSKILLVFFYPLNACCNPYLYAILTKQYRHDLLILLSRHGLCTKRAAKYKAGAVSTNATMQTILRLGSLGDGKANGGRLSIRSHRETSFSDPPRFDRRPLPSRPTSGKRKKEEIEQMNFLKVYSGEPEAERNLVETTLISIPYSADQGEKNLLIEKVLIEPDIENENSEDTPFWSDMTKQNV